MTSPTDERLRTLLRELADDMPSMPLLEHLEPAAAPLHMRRRPMFAVAAVAAAVALLLAGVLVGRDPTATDKFVDPVVGPPRVFHLATAMSSSPGTVDVAVLMGRIPEADARNAHVLPAAGGPERVIPASEAVPSSWYQSLSWDGTRLVRQNDAGSGHQLEVLDLRTGSVNSLAGQHGYCPHLSPDNRTLAVFSDSADKLDLIDVRTGRLLLGWGSPPTGDACTALGWSPTGELLVTGRQQESVVLDTTGQVVDRLPQSVAVNGSMSWSPDGESLLTYNREERVFAIRDVRAGTTSVLPAPGPEAARPLGWAGDRVVWLVGSPGDQRLVSTDTGGGDRQPWMRLAVDGRTIDTVQWSWALSGRPQPATD